MKRLLLFPALMACAFLSGCLAATAVGVAANTVEAGVKVTGAVVGATVDAVTTSDEEKEKKEAKKQKD